MNNYIQKLLTVTAFCFITTCSSTPSNTGNDPNKTNTSCGEPTKSFTTMALSSAAKPNDNLRIKILKKSFTEPVSVTNKYKYPLVETIEHQGIRIAPAVIKTIHHTAISPQEAQRKKKALWEVYESKLKAKYKAERESLQNKQKEERITAIDTFKEYIKTYKEGVPAKDSLIKEQIELRRNK